MRNIKEIICKNLISLRKINHLTQIDLAKKVNYSDKTVSRWENGEVVPDCETLELIASIYDVPIEYFFYEHKEEELSKKEKSRCSSRIALMFLTISFVWVLIVVIYVYYTIFRGITLWPLFVFGVPLSTLVVIQANKHRTKNQAFYITTRSVLMWSLITSVYIFMINNDQNLWPIFFIGVPLQASIVIMSFIKAGKDIK
jgi:transcriptional regulator with XRE-family HTH domain